MDKKPNFNPIGLQIPVSLVFIWLLTSLYISVESLEKSWEENHCCECNEIATLNIYYGSEPILPTPITSSPHLKTFYRPYCEKHVNLAPYYIEIETIENYNRVASTTIPSQPVNTLPPPPDLNNMFNQPLLILDPNLDHYGPFTLLRKTQAFIFSVVLIGILWIIFKMRPLQKTNKNA